MGVYDTTKNIVNQKPNGDIKQLDSSDSVGTNLSKLITTDNAFVKKENLTKKQVKSIIKKVQSNVKKSIKNNTKSAKSIRKRNK